MKSKDIWHSDVSPWVWCVTGIFFVILALISVAAGGSHDPWDGTLWDTASPDIDQPIGGSYKEIYDLRKGVGIRMVKEHETFATASAGGVHKQGSARAFWQSSAPATQVNGDALDSGDNGLLWVDSDDNALYLLTAFGGPTWTPVSTEVISTLLASNRTFGADLDVTGDFDPTTFVTTNGGFLDEDTMSSDSAVAVASQQSIKAYVDTEVPLGVIANAANTLSGSTTTSGTTKTDLAGATETITVTSGSKVLVMFTVEASHSSSGKTQLYIDRGGTDIFDVPAIFSAAIESHTIQFLDESPGSGSTTYKIEWQQFNGGETTTAYDRALTLIEIK